MKLFTLNTLLMFHLISIFGMVTNSICAGYIWTCYPVKKRNIFLLIFMDAIICFMCCSLSFILSSLFPYDNGNESSLCTLLFLSLYIPSVLGPLLTFEVAMIRYATLWLSLNGEKLDESAVRPKVFLSILATFVFIFLAIGIHVYWEVPFSLISEVCLEGNQARNLEPVTAIGFLSPTLILPILSVFFNVLIIILIKKNSFKAGKGPEASPKLGFVKNISCFMDKNMTNNSLNGSANSNGSINNRTNNSQIRKSAPDESRKKKKRKSLTIPVRATVLSVLVLVPYLVMGYFLKTSESEKTQAALTLTMIAISANSIRCLITLVLTYKTKKNNQVSKVVHDIIVLQNKREVFEAKTKNDSVVINGHNV